MSTYPCPECGEPVHQVGRSATFIPIAWHRDSFGKLCPAVGKNLVHYRWETLLKAVYGRDARLRHK